MEAAKWIGKCYLKIPLAAVNQYMCHFGVLLFKCERLTQLLQVWRTQYHHLPFSLMHGCSGAFCKSTRPSMLTVALHPRQCPSTWQASRYTLDASLLLALLHWMTKPACLPSVWDCARIQLKQLLLNDTGAKELPVLRNIWIVSQLPKLSHIGCCIIPVM